VPFPYADGAYHQLRRFVKPNSYLFSQQGKQPVLYHDVATRTFLRGLEQEHDRRAKLFSALREHLWPPVEASRVRVVPQACITRPTRNYPAGPHFYYAKARDTGAGLWRGVPAAQQEYPGVG
jgi:hypothetical protein